MALTNFIIVSQSRTGSTWLRDMLNSHPEITCYGELFVKKDEIPGSLRGVEGIRPHYEQWQNRNSGYNAYLTNVMDMSPKTDHFGFKLMIAQHQTLMRDLIGKGWKVIYLLRSNQIAAYASHLRALSPDAPVVFDETGFTAFSKGRAKRQSEAEEIFLSAGVSPLRLDYTDLFIPETIRKILGFIGADADTDLSTSQARRGSPDILARFANPVDAKQFIKSIGKQGWANETPESAGLAWSWRSLVPTLLRRNLGQAL